LIFAEAAKEPVAEVIADTTESVLSVLPKIGTSAVNAAMHTIGAIPIVGVVSNGISIINDASKAASAFTKVATTAIESTSDAFLDTKNNFEMKLKELEEKKKMSTEVVNRTNKSIYEFGNPNITQSGGGYKSRRRLFKQKAKTRRVRFAI